MNHTRLAYGRIGARPGREKYPVDIPDVVVGAYGNLVCRYEYGVSWVLNPIRCTLLVYSRVPIPSLNLSKSLGYGYVGSMEIVHKSDHSWSPPYELH